MMRRFWRISFLTIGVIVLGFLLAWGMVLASSNPLQHGWMNRFPWPVACSSRGCVTTQDWAQQYNLAQKFSAVTGAAVSSPADALTTAIRQHMVEHAFLKSPVTLADATRYREQILQLTDEAMIKTTFGLTASQYDKIVVLPFLKQQALQQQLQADTIDDLYAKLAQERLIVLLPWHFRWDTQKGAVVTR